MIRPERIAKFENVREAIENRYNLTNVDQPLDDQLFKEIQKMSKASIFEFVGLDKIRNAQRFANIYYLFCFYFN